MKISGTEFVIAILGAALIIAVAIQPQLLWAVVLLLALLFL